MLFKIGRIITIFILIFIQSTYEELFNINEETNFSPCSFKGKALICDGRNMLNNPTLLFTTPTKSNITELEIINFPLTEIPAKYISPLADNLVTVKIHSTGPIKVINLNAFNKCSKITSFEIKSQSKLNLNIEESPIDLSETFRDLISLEELKLINLNVVELNLNYLTKLKSLFLEGCNINTISFGTFQNNKDLTKLHIIELKNASNLINHFLNWPSDIHVPITDLKLENCNLKVFPKFTVHFAKNLSWLSLAKNSIKTVEWNDTINLKSLQNLFLSATDLNHTSMTGLKNLNNLKFIYLINIKMKDLPIEIEQMNSLELISIDMSQLEQLSVRLPSSVKRISASDLNKKIKISTNFLSRCNQLEFLNLNSLQPEDAKFLMDNVKVFQASLKMLGLDECFLVHSDLWKLLNLLGKLEILYLAKANLEAIPDEVLKNLRSLKKLHLSANRLSYKSIDSEGFQNVSNHLTELDLSHNPLKYLQPCVFYSLENLGNVNLIDAEISCDCNLLWLLGKIKTSSTIYPNLNFTCNNVGKTLYQLEENDLISCPNIDPCKPLKTVNYKVDFQISHEPKFKIHDIKGAYLMFMFDYMKVYIKQENNSFHHDNTKYLMNRTSIEFNEIPCNKCVVCLTLFRISEKYDSPINCQQYNTTANPMKQASLSLWICVSIGVTFGFLLIIIGIVLLYKKRCAGKIKNQSEEYYSNCSSKYSVPDETYMNPGQYTEITSNDEYSTDHQDSFVESTFPFKKPFSNHYMNRNLKRLTIPSKSVDGGLDISHMTRNRSKFHKSRAKSRNLNKRLPEFASLHSLNKGENIIPRKYQSTGRTSLPNQYISRDLPIPPENIAMQNNNLPPPKPKFPSSDIKSLLSNADNHLNYFRHYTSNNSLCTDESLNQPHSGDSGLGVSKLSNHSQIRLSDNNSIII